MWWIAYDLPLRHHGLFQNKTITKARVERVSLDPRGLPILEEQSDYLPSAPKTEL
jgi:hypothetical protein